MALRDEIARERDHQVKHAIKNSFALLSNEEILAVCTDIAAMTGGEAAATVIAIIGPEEDRNARLLPAAWGPATLSDPAVATKVLACVATTASKEATRSDGAAIVNAAPLDPGEKAIAMKDIERVGMGALDWGVLSRLVAGGVLAIAAKRLPMLKYADRIPGLVKGIATVGGAVYGGTRALEAGPPPLP